MKGLLTTVLVLLILGCSHFTSHQEATRQETTRNPASALERELRYTERILVSSIERLRELDPTRPSAFFGESVSQLKVLKASLQSLYRMKKEGRVLVKNCSVSAQFDPNVDQIRLCPRFFEATAIQRARLLIHEFVHSTKLVFDSVEWKNECATEEIALSAIIFSGHYPPLTSHKVAERCPRIYSFSERTFTEKILPRISGSTLNRVLPGTTISWDFSANSAFQTGQEKINLYSISLRPFLIEDIACSLARKEGQPSAVPVKYIGEIERVDTLTSTLGTVDKLTVGDGNNSYYLECTRNNAEIPIFLLEESFKSVGAISLIDK